MKRFLSILLAMVMVLSDVYKRQGYKMVFFHNRTTRTNVLSWL